MPIQTYHRSPPQLFRNSTQPQHLTHHCHDFHPAASPSALIISKRRYTLESSAGTRTKRIGEKFRSTQRRQSLPPTQPLASPSHLSSDLATMKPRLTLCFVSGVDIGNSDSSSLPAAASFQGSSARHLYSWSSRYKIVLVTFPTLGHPQNPRQQPIICNLQGHRHDFSTTPSSCLPPAKFLCLEDTGLKIHPGKIPGERSTLSNQQVGFK